MKNHTRPKVRDVTGGAFETYCVLLLVEISSEGTKMGAEKEPRDIKKGRVRRCRSKRSGDAHNGCVVSKLHTARDNGMCVLCE